MYALTVARSPSVYRKVVDPARNAMSHGWSRLSTSTARESPGEFGGSGMSGGNGMQAAASAASTAAASSSFGAGR